MHSGNSFFETNSIQKTSRKILILTNDHTSLKSKEVSDELKTLAKTGDIVYLDEEIDISNINEKSGFHVQLDHPLVKLLGSMLSGILCLNEMNNENFLLSNINKETNEINKGMNFKFKSIIACFMQLHFCYLNNTIFARNDLDKEFKKSGILNADKTIDSYNTIFKIVTKYAMLFKTTQNVAATPENMNKLTKIIYIICNMKEQLHVLFLSIAKMTSIKLAEKYPEYKDNFVIGDISNTRYIFNHFLIRIRNEFMANNIFNIAKNFPDKDIVVRVGKLHAVDSEKSNRRSIQTILIEDLNLREENIIIKYIDDSFSIQQYLELTNKPSNIVRIW